jgi:AraC-like DNA-binding protein
MSERALSLYLPFSRDDQAWGLYVTGIGHASIAKGQRYPAERHPAGYHFDWQRGRRLEHFALVNVVAGRGVFESAHLSRAVIHPGDVLLLFPGEWHRYRPDRDVGWQEFWVTFNGRIPQSWFEQKIFSPENPIFRMEANLSLVPDFETLLTIAQERDPALAPLLASHCHVIISHAMVARIINQSELSMRRTLQDAAQFLLTHLGPLDMPRLARRYGLSYTTFRRAFHEHFGVPPGRFRREARISQAKRLLTETALPLKAIAEQLCFADEFYLMQAFKKNTGLTPTDWRHGEAERVN